MWENNLLAAVFTDVFLTNCYGSVLWIGNLCIGNLIQDIERNLSQNDQYTEACQLQSASAGRQYNKYCNKFLIISIFDNKNDNKVLAHKNLY